MRFTANFSIVFLGVLALSACNSKDSATAAASPATLQAVADGSSGGKAYELVVEERTEPAHSDLLLARDGVQKICAMAAKALNVPVKPFPPFPENAAVQRYTVITDGHSTMRKTEALYSLDTENMQPETGCEVKILPKSTDVTITHNGKQVRVLRDALGKLTVENNENWIPMPQAPLQDNSSYSERRTINNVSLRCLPKSDPVLVALNTLDLCVHERNDVALEDGGNPMTLFARVKSPLNVNGNPSIHITEPTSFKQLDRVDASVFDPASYSR